MWSRDGHMHLPGKHHIKYEIALTKVSQSGIRKEYPDTGKRIFPYMGTTKQNCDLRLFLRRCEAV